MRDDAEHFVARADRLLGRAVQTRVLDRERGATRELLGEVQIGSPVQSGRARRDQRDRAEVLVVRDQRNRDDRPGIGGAQLAQVVLALRHGDQHLG